MDLYQCQNVTGGSITSVCLDIKKGVSSFCFLCDIQNHHDSWHDCKMEGLTDGQMEK